MARASWDFDCAVIGGGPGGLVSALYLRRFLRSAVIINGGKPRAAWIPRTHNLFGYPRGISGEMLLRNLGRQVGALGVQRLQAQARIEPIRGGFRVDYGAGTLKARTVILATGVEDVQPEIHNLVELRRAGFLRYCSICDAYDFRGKRLAVLADGPMGIRKTLFLRTHAGRLDLVLPEGIQPRGTLMKRLRECGVRIHRGKIVAIDRLRGRPGIHIELDQGRAFNVNAAYVELGCNVRDQAFAHLGGVRRTQEGFITITTECRTGVPGLFAVGDCANILSQISVAAGQAAVAATTIHNDLLDY